jgi:hypothetical protein
MTDFHRTSVDNRSFIRGAARILVAPYLVPRPLKIADVIYLASGAGSALYDPLASTASGGWTDLGATKTGIQITHNNAEESFDVDQIMGDISSAPTNWECSVGTQLAEMTPEKLQMAWEGSAITVDAVPTIPEHEIGFGQPTAYTQRRLAVLFQRPNGRIRAYLFHKVQRMPQESSVTHAKTGEQISVPIRFRVLADSTVTDPYKRFFIIRDQSTPTNTGG